MSEWPLIDRHGFADLRLGDDRAVVRERFGAFRVFRRTPAAPETDHFLPGGLMVTYAQDGGVEAIELARPTNPTVSGVALLGRSVEDVGRDLAAQSIETDVHADGADIPAWGLKLYAPSGTVEGVYLGP